jgi:hypothetical protein
VKRKRPPAREPPLPVDVERLRREFPALTAEDLDAYVAVTRRILGAGDPADRARITRQTLARGRAARAAEPRDDDERLAVRYVAAVAKMQGR